MRIIKIRKKDLIKIEAIENLLFKTDFYKNLTLQKEIDNILGLNFAIFDKDNLIGYVLGNFVEDIANIDKIAVLKEYQKLGTGTKLLTYFIKKCKNLKIKNIFLEVSIKNENAIKFYKKFNFVETRVRKRYYLDNSDAIEMSLKLD